MNDSMQYDSTNSIFWGRLIQTIDLKAQTLATYYRVFIKFSRIPIVHFFIFISLLKD